jgi:maleate cis-trans isomerase
VFISCTGFRTIENIAKLEADLGKPVVTSNQATYADCLRFLGVGEARPGFGSLFDRLQAPNPAPRPARDSNIAAE